MSPSEIVAKAVASGMEGIALTDHQSARNCEAIAECAKRAGLKCLFGLEVCTAEEVHTLALFDTVEAAMAMTDFVYAALPKRVNDPEVFGDQPVVTWDDDIVEMEWRILAMPCRKMLSDIAAEVKRLGGLFIAAHVDRQHHSCLGTLGAIPEGIFDAVELSRTADENEWRGRIGDYAVTRSSDAHNPGDVARVWTEAPLEDFSIAALRRAFAARSTALSARLTSFT